MTKYCLAVSSRPILRLQFIGCGKMGEAMLAGLVASEWADYREIAVAERLAERRRELSQMYPDVLVATTPQRGADAVLAVKPNDASEALAALKGKGISRVLSVVAGVTVASLEAGLAEEARVLRCMPNTPALVGFGASALAKGTLATAEDLSWAEGILQSVGIVRVVEESQLDAVTGLSGSGPAYVFLLAEALTAAGVSEGLSPQVADALVRQTIRGAGEMLAAGGRPPGELRADVTSRGGTTAAGIAVLDREGFSRSVAEAVAAATRRSVELGAPGSA